jgi:hypothetical protein
LYLLGVPYWNFLQLQARRNSLLAFSEAVHAYHDDYGCFPPPVLRDESGRPMHSWRVLILPYLAEYIYDDEARVRDDLAQYRFDEPWSSRYNTRLFQYSRLNSSVPYLAIVGNDTAWPPEGFLSLKDVEDGPSRTVMLLEVQESDVLFTEPRDLQLIGESLVLTRADGTRHEITFDSRRFICLCSGEIVFASDLQTDSNLPARVVEMTIIDDGKPHDMGF